MSDTLKDFDYAQIDHVMKGPHKDKKLTQISFIEFISNDDREHALRFLSTTGVSLADSSASRKLKRCWRTIRARKANQ